MKFQQFIATCPVESVDAETAHQVYRKVLLGLCRLLTKRSKENGLVVGGIPSHPWLERSYFARYGTGSVSEVRVHVSAVCKARDLMSIARRVSKAARVESRGDLSELHSLLMPAALHPRARDPQELADAIHWLINASGYTYLEEALLTGGMAFTANANLHPNRQAIPWPCYFKKEPPKGSP